MKIKEAAQVCGLTEKAIRLYESKGLVKPCTEEKNGRTYREYNEENIRTLTSIGVLRRASFSLEQIGIMQSQPEKIPEVFAAYRETIRDKSQRLTALKRAVETMETEAEQDIDTFAARLAAAMLSENITDVLTGETVEKALPSDTAESAESAEMPTEVQYRWYTWDEDTPYDEKEEAYRRFIEKYERREKVKEFFISIPMKAWGLWLRIPKKLRRAVCIAVPIIIVVVFALYNFCITTPFTHTFDGVIYERGNTDPAHLKPVTVTLDGKLRRYLWKDDYFTGEIDFGGFAAYDSVHGDRKLSEQGFERYYSGLRLYYNGFPGKITEEKSLTYWCDSEGNRLDTGLIFMRGVTDGEEPSFVMAVMEPKEDDDSGYHWSSDDGLYIVCPSATVDEAEAVVRDTWARYNELNPDDQAIQ